MSAKRSLNKKRPKTAWQALLRFRQARSDGGAQPHYGALADAIEFLLTREAEKERVQREHERYEEEGVGLVGDPYGGGE